MKQTLLIIGFMIAFGQAFSQSIAEINSKIDSLEKVKQGIIAEKRILTKKEERTDNLIKMWKEKKLVIAANSNTKTIDKSSGISAKVISSGGSLRDKPMGTEILKIQGGSSISVQNEFSNLYFKVIYQGKTGYLSYSSIEQNVEIDMLLQGKISTNENNSGSTQSTDNSDYSNDPKYKRIVEIYGKETSIKIMKKEVWKGMSPGMLMESLGNPIKMTEEIDATGKRQVWHYSNQYVYIQKGTVVDWKAN